ncbi:MAG: hypothetical protein KC609_26775 [Myxococcales bacterium]|nr:hypothetical protein [Myxococcales bacterium]
MIESRFARHRLFAIIACAMLIVTSACGSSTSREGDDDTLTPGDAITDSNPGETSSGDSTVIDTQLPDMLGDVSLEVSYTQQVFSIIAGKCHSCHANGTGGFTLTGVAATDYAEIVARVNLADPPSSLILRKATNEGGQHGGIQVFTMSSADYQVILSWISEGAPNN